MGRRRSLELPTKPPPSPSLSNYAFEKRKWDAYNELRDGTSYRKAAANHTISYRCLFDYARGKKNRVESHEQYMALSMEEEQRLAKHVAALRDQAGVFPSQKVIIGLANELIQAQSSASGESSASAGGPASSSGTVSDTWVSKFLKRHPDLAYDRKLKRQKLSEVSPPATPTPAQDMMVSVPYTKDVLEKWFEDLNKLIDKFHVLPVDIYNMAILGFQVGPVSECKFINHPGTDSMANVTVVECVCTDGTFLEPLVVLPDNQLTNLQAVNTRTGAPDPSTCFTWLRDVFDVQTSHKAGPNWRLLLTDSSPALDAVTLLWAWEHRILLLIVPGSATKKLQPMRLGIVDQLQQTISLHAKQMLLAQKSGYLSTSTFLDVYTASRLGVFSNPVIVGAWNRAGIVPRNPNKVLDQYLSEVGMADDANSDDSYMFTDEFVDGLQIPSNADILFDQDTLAEGRSTGDVGGTTEMLNLEREISLLGSRSNGRNAYQMHESNNEKLAQYNTIMETAQSILLSKTVPLKAKPRLLYSVLGKSYELLVDQLSAGSGGAHVLDDYVKRGQDEVGHGHVLVSDMFRTLE